MNWPKIKLADASDVITKGTTPTTMGFDFREVGIPFIRVQNLIDGTVSHNTDPLFISAETHKILKRSKIHPNDVLVSIAGTIGRVAIVPANAPEMNCNQAVAIMRPNAAIDRRYLLHWMSSENAMQQIARGKVTGTISNLSLSQIGALEVPLPPLDEQKRIAAILDQADELRRRRQRSIDRLNELGQAIFYEMFGDLGDEQHWERLADHTTKIGSGAGDSERWRRCVQGCGNTFNSKYECA
jgi:type I restriction enzyme, S subunit